LEEHAAQLEAVAASVRVCTRCALHQGRTRAVPGSGPANAEIMLIGEGPGFHEDRQGLPFVGAAGQFLDELLGQIGIRRADVFITNVVKCRPPQNRDPLPDEVGACGAYLERQIEVIQPRVVITLGRHSMARWFPDARISAIHGRPKAFGNLLVVPMYHPAAALHKPELRQQIEADFRRLPELLEQHRRARPASTEEEPPGAASGRQLALF
jgi:DNA polymerase